MFSLASPVSLKRSLRDRCVAKDAPIVLGNGPIRVAVAIVAAVVADVAAAVAELMPAVEGLADPAAEVVVLWVIAARDPAGAVDQAVIARRRVDTSTIVGFVRRSYVADSRAGGRRW